jgi:PilZ domain-containing protein
VINCGAVSDSCTVIVAPSELLPGLKERAGAIDGELLTFTDTDAQSALQAIVTRRPRLVALERMFAVTPRGAALINRIKADPSLRQAEIRVLAHNSDYSRVVPRVTAPPPPALDQRGTRRAPRVRIAENTRILIDGKAGSIIDLSIVGAQVVSSNGLKPGQRIAVALVDEIASTSFEATTVWTSFQTSPSGSPRFRVGLDFEGADAPAIEAFCVRHKA